MLARSLKIKKNLFPHILRKEDRLKGKTRKITALKPNGKKLKKECDELWSLIIKEKVGYKSELSGTPGEISGKSGNLIGLSSHHIVHKPNYNLRYDLDNGIVLTAFKEHTNGVHSNDPVISREYSDKIINYIGQERWQRLILKRSTSVAVDLTEKKKLLTNILNNLRRKNAQ
jgi:hypothetical protein